ncbi:MAG: CapA family protein [Firmicutes bacterium]|nr:CapA family protein [Bacillota bacterium]
MTQNSVKKLTNKNTGARDWLAVAAFLLIMLFLAYALSMGALNFALFMADFFHAKIWPPMDMVAEQAAIQSPMILEPGPKWVSANKNIIEELLAPQNSFLTKPPVIPQKSFTTITINAVGDCILASDINRAPTDSFEYYIHTLNKPYSYFFANVKEVFATGDINIANCESVFTRYEHARKKNGDRVFWFKSDPNYVNIYVSGGINAVNVANNHTHDFGEKGFEDTLQALAAAGIHSFGYDSIAYMEVKGYIVALLGYCLVGRLQTEQDLKTIAHAIKDDLAQTVKKSDLMIVTFHWGEEYAPEPSAYQEQLARQTIDNGANLLIGHHSHSLQRVDIYRERLIAYSLGNFVYGGSLKPFKETIILRQTFFMDDELRLLDHSIYDLIEAETYSGSGYNNFQPVLGRPSN